MAEVSSKMIEHFSTLYKSPTYSDITLEIGDEEIPAHKAVLARNQKLAGMIDLCTDQKLRLSYRTQSKAFQSFIKFLYTNKLNPEDVDKNLLIVAAHYEDSDLIKLCEDHFLQRLDDKNVPNLLNISRRYLSYNRLRETATLFKAEISAETALVEQLSRIGLRSGSSRRKSSTTTVEINISNLTSAKRYSDCFNIRGFDWRIYVRMSKSKSGEDHLGVFLKKIWRESSEGQNCLLNVTFILTLMSTDEKNNATRSLRCEEKGRDVKENRAYGIWQMLPFSDLLDATNGYVKDDVISIRVSIHTDV